MTVAGLIEQYNFERPNHIQDEIKVNWLKKCERMLINEVFLMHEHPLEAESTVNLRVSGSTLIVASAGTFEEHIDTFDMDTVLIAPEPYDDLYMYFLDQRIAFNQNDTKRYNVAVDKYNEALLQYQQYFNRMYPTVKRKSHLMRHEVL